ncbi:carboxypeptidase-like regulatory domain-containing protein [Muriicola soli]|uniref:Carboxypeptidase-like regulatory domain-containing protein n=1 Tax=Muriicola soli TaxID=2507538 RepID=A0A411E636_9FLAO|nr:carboxypeptidase-like regulatory domain-containing protein [Muriicola soli]QBA63097.1 carboxypeptidase-like regulatory domain-containing protein [Muriicola soli]
MKKAILLCFVLFTICLSAQKNGSIAGNILDNELHNEPLVFAHIELENTPFQTQTNFRGYFEIEGITPGTYTLIVRYPGYESLELPLIVSQGQATQIQHELSAIRININELVSEETSREASGIKTSPNSRRTRK